MTNDEMTTVESATVVDINVLLMWHEGFVSRSIVACRQSSFSDVGYFNLLVNELDLSPAGNLDRRCQRTRAVVPTVLRRPLHGPSGVILAA